MAGHESTYQPKSRFERWLDERLPIARMMHAQFVDFPTPRNINYLWTTGGMLAFFLGVQILTGIVLAMHYLPSAHDAFNSVEAIRRDVNYGWLIRNLHAVGASMFFLAVYIHIGRGLYYGSYKAPREVLWILGVMILLLMMATAFMGYSLPWGQMSFWAVTVITNLFSSIDSIVPGLGTRIVQWLWGGFAVSGTTLTRFYSLHYVLPFAIVGVVILHIWALHMVGQNNPTGLEIKTKSELGADVAARRHEGHVRPGCVHGPVYLVRLLLAGLSGTRGQLHRGQSALDAASYRTRVVFLALLRDPARNPEQVVGRDRDVFLDHPAVLRALARHLAGPLRHLPSAL